MATILICATTTGYQTAAFREAAQRMKHRAILATDRCPNLDDPWNDQAIPMSGGVLPDGLDAIVALGDKAAVWAARAARDLGLRFSAPDAVEASCHKMRSRERLQAAGLLVPKFQPAFDGAPEFPCVLKPVSRSGSQGVIRANTLTEFKSALRRVRRIVGDEEIQVESFIPGREFALEALLSGGRLQVLAIFDKPDPLDGPFFEETIYVTPSRESGNVQQSIIETTWRACEALGLKQGPIHAEMRVNRRGVWMLEVAARPIGGLCSRVLPGLEEAVISNALGQTVNWENRDPGGVMMIPVTREGVFESVHGLEEARRVRGVEDIVITAKPGQMMQPLPEGNSYLGFIFARGEGAEIALREANRALRFEMATAFRAKA